ncbi:MAG TPA: restriction endonuclease subunit S [Agitococcus sp.]|nr:restriction endonuclease subunit S [Agitococcus sp.]
MSSSLGSLVDIRGGGTPSKAVPEYWGGGIPWASVKDFKSTEISTTADSITLEAIKNSATHLIPAGSIIVPTRMALGKVAVNTVDIAINQDLKALIVKDANKLDQRYLLRFLESKSDFLESQGKGATVKGITLDVLRDLEIPLPPLAEQKRIAAILDKADAIRRKRQQAIKLADEFLRSVFLDMFGDPVSNPKGWPCLKLESLVSKPITYGILKPEEFVPNGIPMLRIQDLTQGIIDTASEFHLVSEKLSCQYKRTILEGGEIVISLVGSIGIVARVPYELHGANVHRNLGVIQLKDSSIAEYITSFMQLPQFMQILERVSKGGVHKLLNLADVKEIEIPMPTLDVIEKYTEIKLHLKGLVTKCESAKKELIFESLSQKAFSGQL